MIKKIIEIYSLLGKKQQKKIIYLQFWILLTAFLEVTSLFSVAPFITILTDFDVINKEGYISDIYNYFGFQSPKNFLFFFAIFFLCITSVSHIINMLTVWTISKNSIKMGTNLGSRLYSFYLNQPWLFHTKNNSMQLINRIAQESDRITLGIIQPAMLINSKFVISFFLISAMVIYNPKVALIVGTILGVSYLIIYSSIKNIVMKNGRIVSSTQEKRYKLMSEGFGGIREVLISGKQNFFNASFSSESDQWASAVGKNQAVGHLPRYIVELIAFSTITGFILYLTSSKNNNQFVALLPVLSIYALGGLKLLPAFQSIFLYVTAIKSNINAFDNIKENLIECDSNENKNQNKIFERKFNDSTKLNIESELSFLNVNFKYEVKDDYVVKDLNLIIKSNETIGIVGKSGSGKSTIIDLIAGLIFPNSGKILIDGNNLTEQNKQLWQQNISLVSQSIFLSDSSIAENIAFGVPKNEIDNNKIKIALEKSQLIDFVDKLPNGPNTFIGERGVQLSGGQRQRVAIARSLYSESKLLIFDEATSSLDGITEEAVINSIKNIQHTKTVVIVAHRLASVKNCDVIYFIENGKVVDSGSYDGLLNRNASFKKMAGVI